MDTSAEPIAPPDTGSRVAVRPASGQVAATGGVSTAEYAVVAAAAALFLYLVFFRDGVFIWRLSQQEGGVWLDEALRTLQGELIYRDFFDFLTPGIVYVNAAFLWLLGPTTTTVGVIVIALGVLAALLLHAISATALQGFWRFLPAPVFVGLTYPSYSVDNHKWPTIIFCLAGVASVARKLSPLRCGLSGIALGFATLCTQDFGIGAAFGLGSALWLLREKNKGSAPILFAAAYAITVGAIWGGFAAAAGFATVWYDTVTFLFEQYGVVHVGGMGLGDDYPLVISAFGLGGLGLAYALIGTARRFWRSEPPAVVITALTGAGLMVIGGLVHPIEPTLFGVRAVLLTILGLLVIKRLTAPLSGRPLLQIPVILVGAGLAAYLANFAIAYPISRQTSSLFQREQHRAGEIWVLAPLPDLSWLEANAAEGERVFLLPDKGGFYFLSRTRNVMTFHLMLDMGFNSDAQVTSAAKQISTRCPTVGLWHANRLSSFAMNRPEWFTLKPLYEVLTRDYDRVAEFPNGAAALRRKGSAECGGRPGPGADLRPN